ncbi:MAG: GNAT family protein [Chloroflexota bacterium]
MAPDPITLALDDLVLRPWRADDATWMLAAGTDPVVTRWTHLPHPFGAQEARAYVDAAMATGDDGASAAFVIADRQLGRALGAVTRFGPEGHIATVGLWLLPEARGRGVGTRALRLVIDWTFATTSVERIDCYIELGNEPSMRMVERVGFRREGLLRAWEVGPDGPIDCVVWSILRTDERWNPRWAPDPRHARG